MLCAYEEPMKYIKENVLEKESADETDDREGALEEQLYDAIDKIDVTRAKVLMADGADCNALWSGVFKASSNSARFRRVISFRPIAGYK